MHRFWTALLLFASALSFGCAHRMERVTAAGDRFALADSRTRFIPWGDNYGKPGLLIEDFWYDRWSEVERDFQSMRQMGANVVRLHLQVGKFMDAPDRMNQRALDQLTRLLRLAERERLYLDITGLAQYRPGDTPAWYENTDEAQRWAIQARFWEAVAERCSGSDAVFCYDLMNEPVSPGDRREKWAPGQLLGGFDFLQFISLDPAGRSRGELARQWIRRMTQAIRRRDSRHLITVGLLPWSKKWQWLSGFVPAEIAPDVDFVSVHIYPEQADPAEALDCVRRSVTGKPLVIEETFPLSCDAATLRQFMLASRGYATGWIGHYGGEDVTDMQRRRARGELPPGEAMMLDWLMLFRDLRRPMTSPGSP